MGVLRPSSVLMAWKGGKAERGVRAERGMAESSEGRRVVGRGVLSKASLGREDGRWAVAILLR